MEYFQINNESKSYKPDKKFIEIFGIVGCSAYCEMHLKHRKIFNKIIYRKPSIN